MRKTLVSGILLLVVLAGARAAPQPVAAGPESGTLDALLAEVRLLRVALERSSLLGARAQLLAGRVALQDQRVTQARAEAQRLESELARATNEQAQQEANLAAFRQRLETDPDPSERLALEQQVRLMQGQLKAYDTTIENVQGRLLQATQALEAEHHRYQELDERLSALEREMEPR